VVLPCAVPYLCVPFHRGGPDSRPGRSCRVLWWTKCHWGRSSQSTSVSPANHHYTNFSIIIITRGCHNRPICGRSGLHPPPRLIFFNCSFRCSFSESERREGRGRLALILIDWGTSVDLEEAYITVNRLQFLQCHELSKMLIMLIDKDVKYRDFKNVKLKKLSF
jgi:hypothetical protein